MLHELPFGLVWVDKRLRLIIRLKKLIDDPPKGAAPINIRVLFPRHLIG